MKSAYETVVKLPSQGYVYEDTLSEVTIRPMTTAEEKFIYGSTSNRSDTLLKLMNSCVVPDNEGNKVDCGALMPGDFDYLITQLRIITFGEQYHQVGFCPFCGNADNQEVDLSDLEAEEINIEDFDKYQEVELSNGDKVELRILTHRETLDVNERVDKIVKKSTANADRDFLMLQHLRAAEIVSVNGEKYTHEKALLYLNKLLARDGAKLDHYNNKLLRSFGMKDGFDVTCSKCSEEYDLTFVNHGEFFRPRFD